MVAPPWSKDELDRLRQEWTKGTPVVELEKIFGRSGEAVRSRVRRLQLPPRRPSSSLGGTRQTHRDCLGCGQPFPSAGIHDRLCDRCGEAGDSDYWMAL